MKQINKAFKTGIWIAIVIGLVVMPILANAQERVSVKADVANMRSGAGTNSDILWQVEKYHPFVVVKKQGNWYRIKDFENDEAWIHTSLLGDVRSVITNREKCNIRSEPSTKSSILFTAERGVPFKLLKTQGDWLKVEHADGDVGWIHKSLVW